jgi:hypothetical protein
MNPSNNPESPENTLNQLPRFSAILNNPSVEVPVPEEEPEEVVAQEEVGAESAEIPSESKVEPKPVLDEVKPEEVLGEKPISSPVREEPMAPVEEKPEVNVELPAESEEKGGMHILSTPTKIEHPAPVVKLPANGGFAPGSAQFRMKEQIASLMSTPAKENSNPPAE